MMFEFSRTSVDFTLAPWHAGLIFLSNLADSVLVTLVWKHSCPLLQGRG